MCWRIMGLLINAWQDAVLVGVHFFALFHGFPHPLHLLGPRSLGAEKHARPKDSARGQRFAFHRRMVHTSANPRHLDLGQLWQTSAGLGWAWARDWFPILYRECGSPLALRGRGARGEAGGELGGFLALLPRSNLQGILLQVEYLSICSTFLF